jgi:hypothetical protein
MLIRAYLAGEKGPEWTIGDVWYANDMIGLSAGWGMQDVSKG